MTSETQPPDAQPAAGVRLRQFLAWLTPTVFGFALLLSVTFAIFQVPPVGIVALVLFGYGGLLLVARAWARRGDVEAAVIMICVGLLIADVIIKLVEPVSPPTLVIAPLLAVVLALPYLRGRTLRRLIGVSLLVTAIIAILEEFGAPTSGMPPWLIGFFRTGSLIAVVALVLLLLWQFSSRLTETLARTQAVNAALRQTEAKYRTLVEQIPAITYIGVPDGSRRLLYVSPQIESLLGYSPDEWLADPELWHKQLHPDDRERVLAASAQSAATGEPFDAEYRMLTHDGQLVWFHDQGVIVRDDTGQFSMLQGVAFDITERKRAEEARLTLERKLLEVQKLESLAALAGGIAHDFNNLLAIILGNVELAQSDAALDSAALEMLQPIMNAAHRAAGLTQQMLAYSGRGRFVVQPLDLNALLLEMDELLHASVAGVAPLELRLAPDLPAIEGDASQIRQVILNLVINAVEAIDHPAGTITLTTSVRYADRSYLATTYLAPDLAEGLYVYLAVTDTGSGMDAHTRSKMFDPFFTTKFMGRGLGLAVVLGIVRGHNGAIQMQSELGRGTTITILFPTTEEERRMADDDRAASSLVAGRPPPPSGGVVLVVDDEEGVRLVASRALERYGFTVLTAADGRRAVELFRAHADEIVCVLLDLTMPLMRGDEVFREILRIKPNARVILMSGYDEHEVTSRFADQPPAGFLQKPFSPQQLQDMLRRIL